VEKKGEILAGKERNRRSISQREHNLIIQVKRYKRERKGFKHAEKSSKRPKEEKKKKEALWWKEKKRSDYLAAKNEMGGGEPDFFLKRGENQGRKFLVGGKKTAEQVRYQSKGEKKKTLELVERKSGRLRRKKKKVIIPLSQKRSTILN